MPEGGDQPLALVLSGGGARGAYEAGVLRYALGKLAPRRGPSALPQIFCGTSVGAINACALAARAELPDLGVRLLAERWESLRLEDVFKLGWGDLAAIARWLVGKPAIDGVTSLLDAGPLAVLVREFIPWRALHENVANARVRAVTLSATDVETGHTIIFVESATDHALYSTDASVEYVPTRLKPQHALASAAIPIIFPTVRVGGRLFVDGSVRQNTPISPAIRMGCERVLVIGLRADPRMLLARASRRQAASEQESLSAPLYLFGKLLDALLLDRVENDLANLRRVNAALRALSPGVLEEQPVALALVAAGGSLRPVSDLFIRPSQDLGKMAADVLTRPAVRARLSGPAGYLMRRIGENAVETQDPSDLLSYLLFD
ncbi:MAG: patatin-like phospholipase family protein, partial [Myxococcales bacterium]